MKKLMIAASLLALTGSAYASKARLLALGQDKNDNYFIQDSRSMFHNAAHVNNYGNTLNVEWGALGSTTLNFDTDGAPKAMGGFFKKSGDWTYGVHVGNESDTVVLLRMSAETTATDLLKADNLVDFFLGKDQGSLKWGWNFLYSNSKSENSATPTSDKEQTSMATRFGVLMDNMEAYINVGLKNESKTKTATPDEFKGKLGLHIGGAYHMGNNKMIASFKSFKWEQKNTFQTTMSDGKYTKMNLGVGNTRDLGNGATLYSQIFFQQTDVEVSFTTTPASMTQTIIPVVIGFEAKANDWLTWRGSVSHNLHGKVKQKNIIGGTNFTASFAGSFAGSFGTDSAFTTVDAEKKISLPNSTAVSAGASLTFGKLTVDGMIGATGGSRGTGTIGSSQGVLTLDNLLTRVGMNYSF